VYKNAGRSSDCRKTYITFKNGRLALLALLVLRRAKLLASNQSILALGVAPHSAPFRGKGVWGFGKDAEIERPKALQGCKAHKAFLKG